MICCDDCSSWQHNECMEIEEDEDNLPEKYLCEICNPEGHVELLAKIERGEKPWEERQKERDAKPKRGRKRKGAKRAPPPKKAKVEKKEEPVDKLNGKKEEDEMEVTKEEEKLQEHKSATPAEDTSNASKKDSQTASRKSTEAPEAKATKRKSRGDEEEEPIKSDGEKVICLPLEAASSFTNH